MKTVSCFFGSALAILAVVLPGCNKEEEPVLDHSYSGAISYEYSRGFPSFKAVSILDVNLDKSGAFTSGTSVPASFDEEAIRYNGTTPEMKIVMTGTVTIDAASGNYSRINGVDKVLVYIHSVVEGTMKIYGWDDDLGFFLITTQNISYEDEFSDGTMEFSLDDAVLTGSTISVTLPDIEGVSTYGYTLLLVPLP